MPGFVAQLFRFLLKLVLGVFAAVFAISLLLAALLVLAFSLLKSLITGRKPSPAMVFGRFQKFSPQGMWPGAAGRDDAGVRGANRSKGDIVDVEVREIPETREDRNLR